MLAAGSVSAQENSAVASTMAATAEAESVLVTAQTEDMIGEAYPLRKGASVLSTLQNGLYCVRVSGPKSCLG